MSSSAQLSVGQKYPHSTLMGVWMAANESRGFKLQVSQNTKTPMARYFSVCFSAPNAKKKWEEAVKNGTCCGAHVRAKGPNRDEMEILSIDLNHTCNPSDPNFKNRKRNYKTSEIANVHDILSTYEPTRTKEGNTNQFINMVKKSTGFSMKTGQAARAIRSKSHDTIEAQIGQYMLIPSAFEEYAKLDPRGNFVLEDRICQWNNQKRQFRRCYVALSIAKHFWSKALIKMFVCDGTFTKLRAFKHILLLAVTFDGNNQVIVLAFAIVDSENSDNWVWFKERLDEDFPGSLVWMSDADKGIESRAFTLSLSQTQDGEDEMERSRCTRHLGENCRESTGGKMNEAVKQQIIALAKSRTEDVYKKRLELIRKEKEAWANYLDSKKHEFVTYCFLERGISRYGKVTSNAVENTNSALIGERNLPVLHMIEALIKYQREKYSLRQGMSKLWIDDGWRLTLFAKNEDGRIGSIASKRTVQSVQNEHPIYRAMVSVGTNSGWAQSFIQVSINVETKEVDCPCKNYDENGAPCYHAKSLLLKVGPLGTGEGWYHQRFHATTYRSSYGHPIPDMSLVGKLKMDDSFLPPEHKKAAGRPQKKRRERAHLRKTNVRRTCHSCGKPGHFGDTCTEPSTEYRVNTHLEEAVQYCQRIEDTNVED